MKKKLIITGCNGQLGRAINKELARVLLYPVLPAKYSHSH